MTKNDELYDLLVAKFGERTTLRLYELFAGHSIYVPKARQKDTVALTLVDREIGPGVVHRMRDLLGGSSLYFSRRILIQRRDEDIRRRHSIGEPYADIARYYQLTETHIRRITR